MAHEGWAAVRSANKRALDAQEGGRQAWPKKFPDFKTDEEAEAFVATVDLSEYDLSDMTPMRFEIRKKDRAVSLRLPEPLYQALKQRAQNVGVPYQRFIRMAIENALQTPQRPT